MQVWDGQIHCFTKYSESFRVWTNTWEAASSLIYGHFEALSKALLHCARNTFVIKGCPCRLQHVGPPFVRGSFYWLRPHAPGHFQSGGAPLSSHLKDNHIEILLTVLHVNGSLFKRSGLLLVSASRPTLSCEAASASAGPPAPCAGRSCPFKRHSWWSTSNGAFEGTVLGCVGLGGDGELLCDLWLLYVV